MTVRATLGDFLQAAHRSLAGEGDQHAHAAGDVEEGSRSLLRVVRVMGWYVQDAGAALTNTPDHRQALDLVWDRALLRSRQALANSAGFLHGTSAPRWPAPASASPLARRLDGVASSLTTGRDLLHTHFTSDFHAGRQHRSEWALTVASRRRTQSLA